MEHHLVDPNPLFVLPFILLLACIALSPFFFKDWWGANYKKVAVGLGVIVTAYYGLVLGAIGRSAETMIDYVSFICLIGSLFVVCGGIHITVAGEAKPLINAVFLVVGAILANIVGTTGASMLLVRPWVRMNKFRYTDFHTPFFIFVVSNTGGSLTPVGDPPLFLGYLHGVPFFWTLAKLWIPWAMVTAGIIALFLLLDVRDFRRVPVAVREEKTADEKWSFRGLHNLGFLAVILIAVFIPSPWREALMIAAAVGSYFTTNEDVHNANDFSFSPIEEVAWLFLGIFATMVPALDYLSVHSHELGIDSPLAYYFCAGGLSSVLDNAPTYLTFLAVSVGQFVHPVTNLPMNINNAADMAQYLTVGHVELMAISLGAVWFGAMTYIGNGPNFMVKAIVEQSGAKAPHFLEYIYRYSVPMLLPILVVVGYLVLIVWQ